MPARNNLKPEMITSALRASGMCIATAAHRLGVHPKTLSRRLKGSPELYPRIVDRLFETSAEKAFDLDDRAIRELYNPRAETSGTISIGTMIGATMAWS